MGRRVLARLGIAEPSHLEHRAEHARQRAERERGGVGFAAGNDDVRTLACGDRAELTNQATLAQPGGTDNPDKAAAIGVEHFLQPTQLGVAAQHQAFVATQHHPVGFHRKETSYGHGRVGAFDSNLFDGPEPGGVFDEACCGQRAQNSARRSRRLHALRHADGMADCGVSTWA